MSELAMHPPMAHAPAAEPSPFGVESKKLAMWLFITADAVTFAAVLVGYGFLRVGSPDWTKPFTFSPTIVNGLVMTIVLLTSSLTMMYAVIAAQSGSRRASVWWIGATVLLGVAFAALHLREWRGMLGEGWSLSRNPLGGSTLVGATFFSITGLHMLHVLCGIVALIAIALGFARGRFGAGHVETTGLYWHFVDLVWMFVFPLVYLLNVR
jgi:heme/copper-type cytochrome/quinol oxidase subunit 3